MVRTVGRIRKVGVGGGGEFGGSNSLGAKCL